MVRLANPLPLFPFQDATHQGYTSHSEGGRSGKRDQPEKKGHSHSPSGRRGEASRPCQLVLPQGSLASGPLNAQSVGLSASHCERWLDHQRSVTIKTETKTNQQAKRGRRVWLEPSLCQVPRMQGWSGNPIPSVGRSVPAVG